MVGPATVSCLFSWKLAGAPKAGGCLGSVVPGRLGPGGEFSWLGVQQNT